MKNSILYIDDEEQSLKYFKRILNKRYNILTATNGDDGLDYINDSSNEVAVVLTDERMPGESGVNLLKRIRKTNPEIVRLMVSAYSNLFLAINAINESQIYKFIEKPWDLAMVVSTLDDALAHYALQKPCWQRMKLLKKSDLKTDFPTWTSDAPYKDAKHYWTTYFEMHYIKDALRNSQGNVSHAARNCGIDRRTLQRLCKRLNLK